MAENCLLVQLPLLRLSMRLPYGGEKWEQQKGNGLPDTTNFYALLEDRQGRIWVGTDNKGVAVWNGKSWQQYNQSNALPGERIFAMAVSPVSGDVAIATSGGLTVYQPETESWKDYTRAEGLPEDQIASLSFDRKGTLWAAFQTSGVASAEPSNGYSRWNVVQTKWYWDTLQRVRQPFEARGKGLPSNFCNAICAESGWIWVGTNSGLGYSKNKTDWNFLRGRDSLRLLTMHTDANPSRVHTSKWVKAVSGKVIWENERGDENILYCPISTTRTLARWSDRGESVDRDFDGPDLGVLIQVPDKNSSSPFLFL